MLSSLASRNGAARILEASLRGIKVSGRASLRGCDDGSDVSDGEHAFHASVLTAGSGSTKDVLSQVVAGSIDLEHEAVDAESGVACQAGRDETAAPVQTATVATPAKYIPPHLRAKPVDKQGAIQGPPSQLDRRRSSHIAKTCNAIARLSRSESLGLHQVPDCKERESSIDGAATQELTYRDQLRCSGQARLTGQWFASQVAASDCENLHAITVPMKAGQLAADPAETAHVSPAKAVAPIGEIAASSVFNVPPAVAQPARTSPRGSMQVVVFDKARQQYLPGEAIVWEQLGTEIRVSGVSLQNCCPDDVFIQASVAQRLEQSAAQSVQEAALVETQRLRNEAGALQAKVAELELSRCASEEACVALREELLLAKGCGQSMNDQPAAQSLVTKTSVRRFLHARCGYEAPSKGYLAVEEGMELVATYVEEEWYYGFALSAPHNQGWFPQCILHGI